MGDSRLAEMLQTSVLSSKMMLPSIAHTGCQSPKYSGTCRGRAGKGKAGVHGGCMVCMGEGGEGRACIHVHGVYGWGGGEGRAHIHVHGVYGWGGGEGRARIHVHAGAEQV